MATRVGGIVKRTLHLLRHFRRASCEGKTIIYDKLRHWGLTVLSLIVVLEMSCVSVPDKPESRPIDGVEAPERRPFDAVEATRYIPLRVADRGGWARDIMAALVAADVTPSRESVCAVVAVIEQESGFQANPVVAELPRIVRTGLEQKFAKLGPLAGPAMNALLAGKAPGSEQSFGVRLDKLRTERDLDRLFRDIAALYRDRFPGSFIVATAMSKLMGGGYLEELNPVTTAGAMQVKVAYARETPSLKGKGDAEAREFLYTRAGGVLVGTSRLFGYPAAYDDIVYRFADFNAGVYAARNAAFQALLTDLTGQKLSLDGDLLAYDSNGDVSEGESQSFKAMLAFGQSCGMWDATVRRNAQLEKTVAFENTNIWHEVTDAWQKKFARPPPYARMPAVTVESPKLTRPRSTAWFAEAVMKRYKACHAR